MASNTTKSNIFHNPNDPWDDPWSPKTNSNAMNTIIQGRMLTAQYSVSSLQIEGLSENDFKEKIKNELMYLLIEEMKKCEYILFTKTTDMNLLQDRYLARIFVTPHDQVQIIRDINKK